ncbi:class I SAM-dependent rRNA methyltransferase [Candidatus Protochlamydia sp. W-9]|uniref:class I SAM-dependent rRNA methyltransferase n=1 Tax=Candidatus Protochlamydia sp. W-9 TaxID=1785087 RepID=UPI00096A7736|nr:class I SAM-dependent rRNA methyltransferase [Candidatus Protochlamydia sp. W-9]
MQQHSVILKPGKDKAIRNYHHWIFSGAVQSYPSFKDGQILPVCASSHQLLGYGYFNRRSGIVGRMVSFNSVPPLETLKQRLISAWKFRQQLFDFRQTNAYRFVHGEGDAIPGLTIDVYQDVFVLQSSTKGIDELKPWIIETLNELFQPRSIFEKSVLPSRKEEGLADVQKHLSGEEIGDISFFENGLKFTTDLHKSQKTGFFLDHREMRQWIKTLSFNKKVLNAFSYTGGFSVYAMAGGAKRVDSVDISQEAVNACQKHFVLNELSEFDNRFICADVFKFLREDVLDYDLVILDPPAFAKKQKDVIAACRGYKDINRLAMQKMPRKSLLLTCSCSHHVNELLFQKVVFQAAAEANRNVRLIGKHQLACDHPINLFHPESDYLKSFLLYLD